MAHRSRLAGFNIDCHTADDVKKQPFDGAVSDVRHEMWRRNRFTLFVHYLVSIFGNILHATVPVRMCARANLRIRCSLGSTPTDAFFTSSRARCVIAMIDGKESGS